MGANSKRSILVVDDEPTVVHVVCDYLERAGYSTRSAQDGPEALSLIDEEAPDLVVLDIMLPRLSGLEVMSRMRRRSQTAVILLSAKGDPRERVTGLRLGADDYVCKPFTPAELVARVQAVLRRAEDRNGRAAAITFDGLEVDPAARTVTVRGEEAHLSPIEFDLLAFFARHPRQVFSRAQLLESVWPYEFYTESATVPVHIRRLRLKIEQDPSQPLWLKTIWGTGYRFDP